MIGAIDDDVNEMWSRSNEQLRGDLIKLADTIMQDFEKTEPIRDGEDKEFLEFVNVIESSFNDLAMNLTRWRSGTIRRSFMMRPWCQTVS